MRPALRRLVEGPASPLLNPCRTAEAWHPSPMDLQFGSTLEQKRDGAETTGGRHRRAAHGVCRRLRSRTYEESVEQRVQQAPRDTDRDDAPSRCDKIRLRIRVRSSPMRRTGRAMLSSMPAVPTSSLAPKVIAYGSMPGVTVLSRAGPLLPDAATTTIPAIHAISTAAASGSVRYASCARRAKRDVDHADAVGVAVRDDPLDPADHRRVRPPRRQSSTRTSTMFAPARSQRTRRRSARHHRRRARDVSAMATRVRRDAWSAKLTEAIMRSPRSGSARRLNRASRPCTPRCPDGALSLHLVA